jgi:hypothetical protein
MITRLDFMSFETMLKASEKFQNKLIDQRLEFAAY